MTPELSARIKRLIVETLRLEGRAAESISDDEPLFGGGSLGLDSIDALELVVAIEREFGVTVPGGQVEPAVFRTVRTLAHWLEERISATASPAPAGTASVPG